jgi:tetratricopeptide (TPR) repeat protein
VAEDTNGNTPESGQNPFAGYKDISEEDVRKAQGFFDRARSLGDSGQLEYAIEMYLQGLNWDPQSIEAHNALRNVGLVRKVRGGKPMGMTDKWKLKKGDDKQNMLNAEKLLAYDPGNSSHMKDVLTNATKAGFYDTAVWIGDILLRFNLEQAKPDFSTYILLKDQYRKIGLYKKALDAISFAVQMKPEDMELSHELKNLGANATISEGNYEGGDFRKSIRDMDAQRKLLIKDTDVRSMDVMTQEIMETEAAYKANPGDMALLSKYVEALTRTEQPDYENRAIEVLSQAHKDTGQYKYKQRIGSILIAQMARQERSLREQRVKHPKDPEVRKNLEEFQKMRAEEELRIFTQTVENYPTDNQARFEKGRRMFELGMFDDAISVFQEARNDPKYRALASMYLGRSFLEAGFVEEARDTLEVAIKDYPVKGDKNSQELTYWYARSLEQAGDIPSAIKSYSQVFMWNAKYRDVQHRIKTLRGQGGPGGAGRSAPGGAGASVPKPGPASPSMPGTTMPSMPRPTM